MIQCRTTVARSPIASHLGRSLEVAIPRLARPERQPAKVHAKHRDRVTRACRNCHKRKVKCSGGLPRCNFCEKVDKPCVYEATRKDKLANATDRNDHLITLLKELSGRVDDHDRSRIEHALNADSDDDVDSPGPSSAGGSVRFHTTSFSDRSRQPSRSQISPTSTLHTPDTEAPSPAFDPNLVSAYQGSSYDNELLLDDPSQVLEHSTGYFGRISEVHWLRDLKSRVQLQGGPLPSIGVSQLSETNFYLDDRDGHVAEQPNPFHLPLERPATELLECYLRTVHVTFPIVSPVIRDQLHAYYQSARKGESVTFPERWFATIHMVLAIGTRFSRLVNTEWYISHDENVYLSSACQLLGMSDTAMLPAKPDLPLIQAYGLLAVYYMSVGHITRAWVAIGAALRFAVAFGLHTQAQSASIEPQQARVMAQTWWSLYNLESLLSSMTGRPCMIRSEDITTPLPSVFEDDLHQTNVFFAPTLSYADAQVRIATITQDVLSLLYTKRRTPRSWAQTHAIISSLHTELDDWAVEANLHTSEGAHSSKGQDMQQAMLKKQYCRAKILITRPSLRRMERCFEGGLEEYTQFDQDAANTCIRAAHEVARLLPDEVDVKLVYEKGPWWTVVHNIMQALAVLLTSISTRALFESSYTDSIAATKKLITWLQYMRETNDMAKRAYVVIHNIVISDNLADPLIWQDIAGLFVHGQGKAPMQAMPVPVLYQSWTGQEQPLQRLFDQQDVGEGGFGYFGVNSG